VSGSAATIEKVTRRILAQMPTRSAFLRSSAAFAFAGPHRHVRHALRDELRILQWAHPTPGYDAWLAAHARAWGERNDARVIVDHANSTDLPLRTRAELVDQRGHDLVQLLAPPTTLQEDVVPMDDVVAEVSRRRGSPSPVARGSAWNPRTRRWFAFPEHYVPLAFVRRTDLLPRAPRSWQEVAARAPGLRRRGHPVGIGFADELDSSTTHLSMLLSHGGRIDRLAGAGTVAYLRFAAGLYRRGLPHEVLDWTPYANNQLLATGIASLIVDPRVPAGARPVAATPAPPRSAPWVVGCTILWRFSKNRELAQRWLVDQQLDYAAHERASGLVVSGWRDDGRTLPAGWPGPTNAAVQELVDAFLLTRTARHVAQGAVTAEEGARQAAAAAEPVFRKWREAGLI
jgi:multiple sugar transport system substrate-binding protein